MPISLADANEFVRLHHRHNKPAPGSKFQVAVSDGEKIVGVVIVGRPVARMADDGYTLEVNRSCTDGTPNVNSMLYGAAKRATFALGYRKLVTFTLRSESGSSLRASGYRCIGEAGGGKWSRPSRPREDDHPTEVKLKWEVLA